MLTLSSVVGVKVSNGAGLVQDRQTWEPRGSRLIIVINRPSLALLDHPSLGRRGGGRSGEHWLRNLGRLSRLALGACLTTLRSGGTDGNLGLQCLVSCALQVSLCNLCINQKQKKF